MTEQLHYNDPARGRLEIVTYYPVAGYAIMTKEGSTVHYVAADFFDDFDESGELLQPANIVAAHDNLGDAVEDIMERVEA